MKEVSLTQDKVTIVDDEDFWYLLNLGKWSAKRWPPAYKGLYRENGGWYAYNTRYGYMHRVIMRVPWDMQVHHVNGDGLDNRRSNLIVVTWWEHQNYHRRRGVLN